MLLLSSAKVSLTNMGPRAKPRLFSVSLTQNFQRGRQVCKRGGRGYWGPASFPRLLFVGEKAPGGAPASCQSFKETFADPGEVI